MAATPRGDASVDVIGRDRLKRSAQKLASRSNVFRVKVVLSKDRAVFSMEEFALHDQRLLPKIHVLDLGGTSLNELRGIHGLENLRSLNASRTFITSEDLGHLSRLEHLKKLDVGGNDIDDTGPLAALTRLEVLGLSCVTAETLEGLQDLGRLRYLDLYGNGQLGPDVTVPDASRPTLREVDVRRTPRTFQVAALRTFCNPTDVGSTLVHVDHERSMVVLYMRTEDGRVISIETELSQCVAGVVKEAQKQMDMDSCSLRLPSGEKPGKGYTTWTVETLTKTHGANFLIVCRKGKTGSPSAN